MRILAVTNMYPEAQAPDSGVFVEQQIKGLREIGLEVDIMFVERIRRGMSAYIGLAARVRARVKHFHPDVVHAMYGGVLADNTTRAVRDVPVIVSFCGSDLLGEQLSGRVRKLIAGYGVLASRWAARRAAGIVVKSSNLAAALPSDVDPGKVRVIPNGVDVERFKPLEEHACRNQLGWKPDLFHVLFPSSFSNSVKRYGLACAAVEKLEELGIRVEMHELRGLPHDLVPIWMNACDVVLLTSSHEGSPNIVKEALACNIPIVSVDVGDVRERIHGIEGCYLASPEPADLAAKLRLIHAGPRRVSSRQKMQHLSIEGVALKIKDFYEDVVACNDKWSPDYDRLRSEVMG